ncbi:WG containing repeat-containing protein [Mucilaginibacter mallensis]|uniref:WG containing repeat-containing protein n=1 Tax=Mucilaginibacter mallensis TaxID=652787 RepID=A0A1H2BTP0_MUCMA|nr:WG repeat-containing protein [Mucilaginibacter mallensis]SDT61588.1 WG containing repeat-containing protein [Mucilaginibacter mallensis]
MSISTKRLIKITVLIFVCITNYVIAQPFVPDNTGYVKGAKFLAYTKNKGYSLVGAFKKSMKDSLWYAKVLKDGQWITIDNLGNIAQNTIPTPPIKSVGKEIMGYADEGSGPNDFNPFTYVHPSNIDLKIIQNDNKRGLINTKNNKIIVPAIYDDVRLSNFKFIIVKLNGKWGVISKQGQQIISPKYDEIKSLGVNMAGTKTITADAEIVRIGDKWGLLSEEGKEIFNPQFDKITSSWVINSLLITCLNNKYGLMNKSGKELIKPIYSNIQSFNNNGETIVAINDGSGVTYGLIDSLGNEPIKPIYKRIAFIDKSLVAVYAEDFPNPKLGLSNIDGKVLTPLVYTGISFFKNDLAIVYISIDHHQLMGFINKTGKQVIKPVYQDIEYINGHNGYYKVKLNGKYGIMTIKLDYSVKPIYDEMGEIVLNKLCVKKDGKYGLIDYDGNILLPIKYDYDFSSHDNGLIQTWLNGKKCMIDLYGNEYFN